METQIKDTKHTFERLEDSFSLPENQKRFPEDPFVEAENRKLEKKWHEKMVGCRRLEKKLNLKIC